MREQQYIVTYKNKETLEWLRKKCHVTYSSVVLNLVFLDTNLSKQNLLDINGVMSANQTSRRLRDNKKTESRYW